MKEANSMTSIAFDALDIGTSVSVQRTITAQDIQLFAALSGDYNPVHLDADYASTTPFGEPIAHGMLCGALVSAVIAMHLPGPGSIYRSQQLKFSKPVFIGDELTITVTVEEKKARTRIVTLDCSIGNQNGAVIASGSAAVIAPDAVNTLAAAKLPAISVDGERYQQH